ncbi:molybdate ABC transporter substrate-binding protein [Sporosarcina sp. ACRSL]|uniref:molybdate ABC transporter substrate-binding protein n=1 Tax=Sporosarcina sp. ACRSL TaxID=2918215 RepID=UPI001EF721B7|nr:molybdate ABC transporter substrate-binding protein [Sporosarcina sp. ACRSL]MCG7345221.1 molybdate ABC transporter substrate-binding protein [Sporosarcina sp. ACRSL]
MKRFLQWSFLLLVTILFFGCSNNKEDGAGTELAIAAAASLTDALTELKYTYEKENDGVFINLNFGSSRKLATQIEQGAPADVFLSASTEDMTRMKENGLVIESSIVNFTGNSLVLITNKSYPEPVSSFEQLDANGFDHLSIGEPETVPAGRYTKEVLENLQMWMPLQSKLVMGSDVRQVLTHVEMGNADYGIVYASDAFVSDKVTVVTEADSAMHSPIVYPGAVVKDTEHPQEAENFLKFVASEEGRAVLKKHGFK